MQQWFKTITKLVREIRSKAFDAIRAIEQNNSERAEVIHGYLKNDLASLQKQLPANLKSDHYHKLSRHIRFRELHDYLDIINSDLPALEDDLFNFFLSEYQAYPYLTVKKLLHAVIKENCYEQYKDGHFRDAVLNSIIAVFDLIREKARLDLDGEKLIGAALSTNNPKLILSDLGSESGKNDQIGFLQILQGAYKGIRNPKAHSIKHDLDELEAAQYLIFASLLARRIDEAKVHGN